MPLKVEREAKLESEPCVLAWDNKLFVGTEDGFIKVSSSIFAKRVNISNVCKSIQLLKASE